MRSVIAWMVLIFLFSSIPDLSFLHLTEWPSQKHQFIVQHIHWDLLFTMRNPFWRIPDYTSLDTIIHKIGHLIVYSVLGILAFRMTKSRGEAVLIAFCYAEFDELHQAFTPGRSSRLADILLDTIAAYLAILLYRWFLHHKSNRPPKKNNLAPK